MSPKPSIFAKGRTQMANRTRPNQLLFCVIIKVDYTQQKKLAAAVSRVAANINHICRRINSTGHFYEDDVAELKERQQEIWQLLKSSQSEEL
jgi:alpha/beta superfamily hydrolase